MSNIQASGDGGAPSAAVQQAAAGIDVLQRSALLKDSLWSSVKLRGQFRAAAYDCSESDVPLAEFATRLVDIYLREQFAASLAAASVERMSRTIGQTLCGDPTSRQRLIDLQRQLTENSA